MLPTIMVLLYEKDGPEVYFFNTVEKASAFCDVATGSLGYQIDIYHLNDQDQYEYSHTLN